MSERRFIEELFPIKKISDESVREKRLRNGHISTLHVWWARRPLASSRATIYSSLIPFIKDPKKWSEKEKEVDNLAKWKNSNNYEILSKIRKEISKNFHGKSPKILDPFGGGGSIPLEATRLGCETYTQDYNPVATLILKCTTEYPQRYSTKNSMDDGIIKKVSTNKLLNDVKKWGDWINDKAKKELEKFYPKEKDGSDIVGYIWVKTIHCQNPSCGAEIPLIKNYYLSKKKDQIVFLYPIVKGKKIKFKIVDTKKEKKPKDFDPNKGSIFKATAKCFVCQYSIDDKATRRLFSDGDVTEKLVAVISFLPKHVGKNYRIADEQDYGVFQKAKEYLKKKRDIIINKNGFDPIPTEELPPTGVLGFRIQKYGMKKWSDLFNERQQLSLIVFSEKVRNAYDKMLKDGYDKEYAKAIVSYLAIGVDRLANYGSKLCYLNYTGGRGVANTFGKHILIMVPNYAESNPFNPAGASWPRACETNESWLEHATKINSIPAVVSQSSATSLSYSDEFFDAVFTDPPYYDNIAYSYLSDFFYIWLKRMLGNIHPELFSTPLTPKSDEIVAHPNIEGGPKKAKILFESMLKKSFSEIARVLKTDGICVIVYAHKSTSGWETLINSLLESGLVITAAWPIHTEMQGRLEAKETAVLASSIYMVARKWKKKSSGFYRDVKKELKQYLNRKLEQIWNEGIGGADFFISAIGSAIEVFGKYEEVVDDNDKPISVSKLLNDTREIVTNYAIKKVLRSEFSDEISKMTRFYILWRWAYGEAKTPFDDARKMAQSTGIDIEHEWNKGFIIKDKEFIRVIGPDERKEEDLEEPHELIDVLHHTLLLWKKNKKEELEKLLREKGYDKSDMFKRVAQAISESLPPESTEKKWLDGFLTGFRADDSQSGVQTKLI